MQCNAFNRGLTGVNVDGERTLKAKIKFEDMDEMKELINDLIER